jgi:hypothetical protein
VVFDREQQLAGILSAIKESRLAQGMRRFEIAPPLMARFTVAQTMDFLTLC